MNVREAVLDRARSQLGYTESPAGSNNTKFGAWYGMNYQPWCAMFASWCGALEGVEAFAQGARWSYCPYIEADARAGRYGLHDVSKTAGEPGDLVTFDFDGDGVAEHVGLIENRISGGYTTLEGNTSSSSNANGGRVERRTRYDSSVSLVARYDVEPPPPQVSALPVGVRAALYDDLEEER